MAGKPSGFREKRRDSFEGSNRKGVAVVITAWGGLSERLMCSIGVN
jgi:hypothetical protein